MSRDLYRPEELQAMRADYEGTTFGDHVGAVMEAAADDVKSVVLPITDAVGEVVHSTTRDVAFFIAGAVFTLAVVIIARVI